MRCRRYNLTFETTLTATFRFARRYPGFLFFFCKPQVKPENDTQKSIIQGKKCDKGYVTVRRRV
ncbi:hypothetical protein EKN29_05145 [Enterobacter mori]|uniref:Uncharacterized protein n=1 Tax=Enterobacter mori TaxID=539813 RepID=A0A9Q7NU87_9ENTR|nr:hypothetical protein EKN29_05145 [Enterobacter mori]